MRKNSAVSVEKPGEFQDELTALLRRGAQQLLLQAVETELEMFLEDNKQLPEAWMQRCWVHKIANVLNKVPKSVQPRMKQALHEIWMAETREDAHRAFDLFVDKYEAKYPKAVRCLERDRKEFLAFYDFPAEHWQHIRTTNPIESTFATVRLRTAKTRGCVSRTSILAVVFKLGQSAQKRWQRIRGYRRLPEVIQG